MNVKAKTKVRVYMWRKEKIYTFCGIKRFLKQKQVEFFMQKSSCIMYVEDRKVGYLISDAVLYKALKSFYESKYFDIKLRSRFEKKLFKFQ